eukprot:4195968-Pleurochrysis_carterae.AAC.1
MTNQSPATRPAYRIACANSDRDRLLVAEVNASTLLAGLALESKMESMLLEGLLEASDTESNHLHHAYTRLNRSPGTCATRRRSIMCTCSPF